MAALVMALIDPDFVTLAGPPSLESCTRDVYPAGVQLPLSQVHRMALDLASVAAHLHENGVLHGDFYAHNTLHDGQGGVLVGDASDYATLLQMMLNDMALPSQPEWLILPALEGSAPKALGVAALPDSAQICSCHNVSKGDICQAVSDGAISVGAIK